PVAGTLNFAKGGHLYGRYWGCVEDFDALHFECCYYPLVEHAIDHGFSLVEAGAQGQHKIARGFLRNRTYSAQLTVEPQQHRAGADFCREEAEEVAQQLVWLAESSPFRGADGGD